MRIALWLAVLTVAYNIIKGLISVSYELLTLPWLDVAGSFAIAWFAFSEGRESFQKARSKNLSCSCGSCKD